MKSQNIEPIRVETESGWIVTVHVIPWSSLVELHIVKKQNGKIYAVSVGKHGLCEMTELAMKGEKVDPAIVMDYEAWIGLSEALKGVATIVDKKEIDAELKATKYHLEDMRKLVFK